MADNEKTEKKEEEPQDVELITWYKKIEIIGIVSRAYIKRMKQDGSN
jgi:hypothetical protein